MYDQGSYAIDRLITTIVPEAYTFDLGFGYRNRKREVTTTITNVFNRAVWNKGASNWLDPKFPLTAEVSFVRKF